MMRGAAASAVVVATVAGAGALRCVHANASISRKLTFILHLHRLFRSRLAGDEVVFFRVVAEGAERNPQQLRRLRLLATGALQRLEHEDLPDSFEMILQRNPVGR